MRLGNHVEKKMDNWSDKSRKKLAASMRYKMKKIYLGILESIEKEKYEGRIDEATCKTLRARALNLGNDNIRTMEMELEHKYNIEYINYHINFKIIPE